MVLKHKIINCLATTGLSLILLALVASFYQGQFLFLASVYQTFIANIIIHVGLSFLNGFESKYFIAEILVEISYVLIILLGAGSVFGWYRSTPMGILIFLGLATYFISSLIGIFRIQNDVAVINKQLKRRREELIR